MRDLQPIIVVGAGGHGRVLVRLISAVGRYVCVGVLDRSDDAIGETIGQSKITGSRGDLVRLREAGLVLAALAIGDNQERFELLSHVRSLGFSVPTLVHPSANVESGAVLGDSSVLCLGCIIGAEAVVGENVIINSGAIVDHETSVGDHCHIAPGCRIAGRVAIGPRSFIGIGAVVRHGISIGADVVVGAGSVVVADIPDGVMAYGVPAKIQPSRGREPRR